MIKVNFKELKSNTNDFDKQLKIMTSNASASGFADEVAKEIKGIKCDTHQNATKGIIDVKADLNKIIVINKHSFCCNEFKDSIDINVKK